MGVDHKAKSKRDENVLEGGSNYKENTLKIDDQSL